MSIARRERRRARFAARGRRRLRPEATALEPRSLLTSTGVPFEPTDDEQYMLQLVDRARAGPAEEGARLLSVVEADPTVAAAVAASGEDLGTFLATISAIPAEAPLAFNTGLIEAARDHDSAMIAANAQVHSPSGFLTDPSVAASYDGQAYYPVGPGAWSTGENIFAYSGNVDGSSLQAYVDYFEAGFLLDWGNPDFDHLANILAPAPSQATAGGHVSFSEIGIGLAAGTPTTPPVPDPSQPQNAGLNVGPVVVTQEFGQRSGDADLTGVVYQDRAGTGFYAPIGEGYGGATIQAVGREGEGTYLAQTWGSGGYTLPLPPGSYTVSVVGGGIPYPQATVVSIGPDNVEWDASFAGGPQADVPIPADYDGDGRTDLALYRPSTGQWIIERSTLGPEVVQFGAPGDIPVPADYDGDGRADLALYRPSTGQWIILQSTAGPEVIQFGDPGVDVPIPADYDGDGRADLALYRPTTGQWIILRSTLGPEVVRFGDPGVDVPIPADYDGDGRADLALYRPTTGQWIILRSTLGPEVLAVGAPGLDSPLTGDFDGDGKADPTLFRPSTALWIMDDSAAGLQAGAFGQAGSAPAASQALSASLANPAVSTTRSASPAGLDAQGPAEPSSPAPPIPPPLPSEPLRHSWRRRLGRSGRSGRGVGQK